jgi:predicted Zn-dependent protease
MSSRFWLVANLVAVCILGSAAASAQVDVGKPSSLRNLVPAGQLENAASQQYGELKRQAAAKGALAPDDHPQVRRLRAIAADIVPFVAKWNPRAGQWRWEVNLIGSKQINAFCMPGGKIAFYTGILDTLKLTDDEVAMIMGHEIAHALREHARERIAKSELTSLGASLLGEFVGGGKYAGAFQLGGNLLTLKFSRDDESEADVVGLELAARAGYDPRAGVSLWRKMAAASRGAPPAWLSTHPSGNNRIQEIERQLPQVMPLYQQAARTRR